MEVGLEFENLHLDGNVCDHDDALLRLCGDVLIVVRRQTLYRHIALPMLEFALSLAKWVGVMDDRGPEFVYTSMESEVRGLIEFRPEALGKCRVTIREACDDVEHASRVLVDTNSVRQACEQFLRKLGPDVRSFFEPADYLTGPELLLLRRFWS